MTSFKSDHDWKISIKQLGMEKDFTVQVNPQDGVDQLFDCVERATGLAAAQQRLIYRGRLILNDDATKKADSDSENNQDPPRKIKDIVGLGDGHTIHLMHKRATTQDAASAASQNTSSSSNLDATSNHSAGPLLAALLGLDATDHQVRRTTSNNNTRRRWNHHRLTRRDVDDVPDPGSMEAVRQGLLTLHTILLDPVQQQQQPNSLATISDPTQIQRRWYVGQWVDCLDTVNQWLEATIVQVVPSSEVLQSMSDTSDGSNPLVNNDGPFVSASDMQGRRRLLFEPCEGGGSGDSGDGLQPRTDNDGVQLLLIHYNGWPHRWDEWLRSDSERLRPFRVRTRHPSTSQYSSPTPLSSYTDAPPTYFCANNERDDRQALLPELARIMNRVNALVNQASERANTDVTDRRDGSHFDNLPWTQPSGQNDVGTLAHTLPGSNIEIPPPMDVVATEVENQTEQHTGRELELLAPLLDRLGRTLIDAAPHVAALGRASRELNEADNIDIPRAVPVGEVSHTLGGLLSLLSRDRRRQASAIRSSLVDTNVLRINPDLTDFATGVVNTTRGEVRRGSRGQGGSDDSTGLLGAYLAVAGMGGSLIAGDDNEEGGVQGLGRLLRSRGGTGGIDIHIHAVVTGTGTSGGGLTVLGAPSSVTGTRGAAAARFAATRPSEGTGHFLSLGRGSSSRSSSSNFRRSRAPVAQPDDEDADIFSELYSDNPEPIDPNRSPERLDGTGIATNPSLLRLDEVHRPGFSAQSQSVSSTRSRGSHRNSSSSASSASTPGSRRRGLLGRFFRRDSTN
jgi:hypothetical protein